MERFRTPQESLSQRLKNSLIFRPDDNFPQNSKRIVKASRLEKLPSGKNLKPTEAAEDIYIRMVEAIVDFKHTRQRHRADMYLATASRYADVLIGIMDDNPASSESFKDLHSQLEALSPDVHVDASMVLSNAYDRERFMRQK